MANVVYGLAVSLDGFMSGPNGEIDWHLVDDELLSYFNEYLGAMSAFIHGRVTWEGMVDAWPTAESNPDFTGVMRDFARIWLDMPKLVYSRTLESVGWGAELRREVVPSEIQALEGDVSVGGPALAETFLAHDLIDEFRLYVNPVVLGEGKPMFPRGGPPRSLRLVETRQFGNGVVLLRYTK